MNEQLIRSIIKLYALLAGSDGLLEEEKKRIEQFLGHHLSGRSVAIFMDLLNETAIRFEEKRNNQEWINLEIESIAKVVNQELKLSQKFYLYLELVELSALDGDVSIGESNILRKIEQVLNFNLDDLSQVFKFGLAQNSSQLDISNCLIFQDEFDPIPTNSLFSKIPTLKGEIVVLKLPSIETYFVRYFGEADTYLNGQLMHHGMSRVWASGVTLRQDEIDPIFFTDVREKFSTPIDRPPILFEVEHVEFKFPNGKTGLQEISFSEKGGRMIAIMGASGCGKSTLFNVLNGNEIPSKGQVIINGKNIHENPAELEGVIGYVPQDDVLNEHLTVFQNLYFSAKFSFGNWPNTKIGDEVDRTLNSLGLKDVKGIEVGSISTKKISGGQRKRLNIGMELIRQPSILFVDEPTSGLSSRDSVKTMELLKDLALNGKLVFVIIHQPSPEIFKMFDRLLVLDQGGHPIYYHNPLEAVPYFRKAALLPPVNDPSELANAAEIFDIIELKIVNEMGEELEERKRLPREWYQLYNKSHAQLPLEKVKTPIPKLIQQPNVLKQILIYLQRDLLSKVRDYQYMIINLFEAPFLALLLAIVVRYSPSIGFTDQPYLFFYNENIPAYFFMSVIVALFMGLSVSAEEIIRDRLTLKREKFLHLSRSSYLTAKILLLFSLSALHTLAFVAISDFVLKVPDIGFEFWMVLFSTSCCANMLGLVLSDTLKKAVAVYILIPLLLIPQLVLGGIVVQFDKLNPTFGNHAKVPIVGEMMVARWAYEALMVAQFKNNNFKRYIFNSEQRLEEYKYKRTYYLTELENMLNEVYFNSNNGKTSKELEVKQALLLKELRKEGRQFGLSDLTWNALKKLPISDKEHTKISQKLVDFKDYYNQAIQKEEGRIDKILSKVSKIQGFTMSLSDIKQASENERICQVVTNDNLLSNKAEITDGGIVRKATPIYQLPEPNHFFDIRAQFYAPMKHFMGKYFPTETFNIFVIWMITFLTAMVLRFRLLRWLLNVGL